MQKYSLDRSCGLLKQIYMMLSPGLYFNSRKLRKNQSQEKVDLNKDSNHPREFKFESHC